MEISFKRGISIIFSFLFISSFSQNSAEINELPKPSGEYQIGTYNYQFIDNSRTLTSSDYGFKNRIICAQIWYPAEIDDQLILAPMNPVSDDYKHIQSNSYLEPSFKQLELKSKVIFISPGRGTERFVYTTIAEELASNGYTVVSVDMPEIGKAVLADGSIIKPNLGYSPGSLMRGPYEKVDEFFETPTQIGYEDLMYVYNKLIELDNKDPNGIFTNRLNLEEIGIFGHSLGGRIAGKFAVENKNIKAYISMEGIPPRDVRYEGKLSFPVAMLCSSGTWPYAKENYFSLIDNRKSDVFMIELPDFGHNSVTDIALFYPDRFNYKIDPKKGLDISKKIILMYFDSYLNESIEFKTEITSIPEVICTQYD